MSRNCDIHTGNYHSFSISFDYCEQRDGEERTTSPNKVFEKASSRVLHAMENAFRHHRSRVFPCTFTNERRRRCQRVRGLSSLLLSEAELERKSLLLPSSRSSLPSFLPLSSSYSGVYFANPPNSRPWLGSNLRSTTVRVATPYRVLNTNRDVSFREFPEDFQDAIITINEEVNGASGLFSLSLLPFRSSTEHP